jgi:hypothetical protein
LDRIQQEINSITGYSQFGHKVVLLARAIFAALQNQKFRQLFFPAIIQNLRSACERSPGDA